LSVTTPVSSTETTISSGISWGLSKLAGARPGRLVLSSRSTLTAPAMTIKKSMITNTTSIIGAIWKPMLTASGSIPLRFFPRACPLIVMPKPILD